MTKKPAPKTAPSVVHSHLEKKDISTQKKETSTQKKAPKRVDPSVLTHSGKHSTTNRLPGHGNISPSGHDINKANKKPQTHSVQQATHSQKESKKHVVEKQKHLESQQNPHHVNKNKNTSQKPVVKQEPHLHKPETELKKNYNHENKTHENKTREHKKIETSDSSGSESDSDSEKKPTNHKQTHHKHISKKEESTHKKEESITKENESDDEGPGLFKKFEEGAKKVAREVVKEAKIVGKNVQSEARLIKQGAKAGVEAFKDTYETNKGNPYP